MRREEFEHVIAAAAVVSAEREINAPAKAEEIDGSLGDGSLFQSMYGYYAHGVGPETAVAPAGWEERLVGVEVSPRVGRAQGAVALCLEVHDLVLAKCAAGRDRDWEFAADAISAAIVRVEDLLARVADLPEPPADRSTSAGC